VSAQPLITRVDLYQNPNGIFICKYAEGWTASTPAIARYTISDRSLDDLVDALQRTSGWTVRRWPGGARAWRGKPMPIRSRTAILRKRDEVTRLHPSGVQVCTLDFALDM
jgi:hypothetical protein